MPNLNHGTYASEGTVYHVFFGGPCISFLWGACIAARPVVMDSCTLILLPVSNHSFLDVWRLYSATLMGWDMNVGKTLIFLRYSKKET